MSETKTEIPVLEPPKRWIRVGMGKRDHIGEGLTFGDYQTMCGMTVDAPRVVHVDNPQEPCQICVDVYNL